MRKKSSYFFSAKKKAQMLEFLHKYLVRKTVLVPYQIGIETGLVSSII